jgi:hypothetical protein
VRDGLARDDRWSGRRRYQPLDGAVLLALSGGAASLTRIVDVSWWSERCRPRFGVELALQNDLLSSSCFVATDFSRT